MPELKLDLLNIFFCPLSTSFLIQLKYTGLVSFCLPLSFINIARGVPLLLWGYLSYEFKSQTLQADCPKAHSPWTTPIPQRTRHLLWLKLDGSDPELEVTQPRDVENYQEWFCSFCWVNVFRGNSTRATSCWDISGFALLWNLIWGWWLSSSSSFISVCSVFREVASALLQGKARLLLFTQSSWSGCWNKNKSIYAKPARERVCSINEDINYLQSSMVEPLVWPELKSPCKKPFYGHARKHSPCSEGWRIWKAHTYAHLGRWGSERVIGKKRCKIWEKHSGSNWTPDVCLRLAFWGQY